MLRAEQSSVQTGFVVSEVARYDYDAWGNATATNLKNAKIDGVDVADFNPIRWKSQYFDTESGFYYIDGRYYSPEIRQYLSPENPESALANALTIYDINPYNLCLTNPISVEYNENTAFPSIQLVYDPPKLTRWQAFWQITWKNFWGSKVGKWLSVGLTVVATFLAVLCPAFVPYYLTALIGTTISLLGGGIIAGFGHKHNFWSGFAEFVNQEWAPSFAISMSLAMLSFGVSQVAQAISNAAPKCFKAGTLVACLDDSGEETLKPIEEITVGDKVLAFDEETGEQGYKEVVQLFRNETQEWYHVFVGGEEIICTAEHPFYVVGKGFVSARELNEGDNLISSNGVQVKIDTLKIEYLEFPETTYNFEVEDFHTYYVTETKVLVHNVCETKLYRAMSDAEYGSLKKYGKFKFKLGTMQDKWMATNYDDAITWGNKLMGQGNFRVVEIRVPTSSLSKINFANYSLDGIGRAYSAHYKYLNNIMIGFERLL